MKTGKTIRWTATWWEIRRRMTPDEVRAQQRKSGPVYHGRSVRCIVRRTKREILPRLKRIRAEHPQRTYFVCRSRETTELEIYDD